MIFFKKKMTVFLIKFREELQNRRIAILPFHGEFHIFCTNLKSRFVLSLFRSSSFPYHSLV